MQAILTLYSTLFMRFALRVTPKNYMLFGMHLTNFFVQGRHLIRRLNYERNLNSGAISIPNTAALTVAAAATTAVAAAAVANQSTNLIGSGSPVS